MNPGLVGRSSGTRFFPRQSELILSLFLSERDAEMYLGISPHTFQPKIKRWSEPILQLSYDCVKLRITKRGETLARILRVDAFDLTTINPHRARETNPRIDSADFRVVLILQSVAAFQNHGSPKLGPWDLENAEECEFATER
jgi:hypothetical protein